MFVYKLFVYLCCPVNLIWFVLEPALVGKAALREMELLDFRVWLLLILESRRSEQGLRNGNFSKIENVGFCHDSCASLWPAGLEESCAAGSSQSSLDENQKANISQFSTIENPSLCAHVRKRISRVLLHFVGKRSKNDKDYQRQRTATKHLSTRRGEQKEDSTASLKEQIIAYKSRDFNKCGWSETQTARYDPLSRFSAKVDFGGVLDKRAVFATKLLCSECRL